MRLTSGLGEALPLLIAAFAAAALLALALTPVVRRLAIEVGMVDNPERRRVNTRPVPRAGGIATMTAFVLVALLAIGINAQLDLVPLPVFLDRPELIALLAGRWFCARA